MRRTSVALAAVAALVLAACSGNGGTAEPTGSAAGTPSAGGTPSTVGTPTGHVDIVVWHGYTGSEAAAMKNLVAQFNSTHPNVTVTQQYYGNSDYALQKVLTAIAGGKPPDLSYLYGSWAANIAKSPRTVALNDFVNGDPSFGWRDFWPAERAAATVSGKIVGVPALVDNLALVYNKRLFDAAGLSYPTAQWTWTDFENAAERLTNPATKQFGWAYVADGSEDTVWRFWALLWQAGGSILTPDGNQAAFDSPAGLKALDLLQTLAQRKAIYLDNGNGNYLGLFTAGHIGMLFTGPWDLPDISAGKEPYTVQILPGDVNHQTISGPDNWVMFDNGEQNKLAAWEFLKWFTSPQVDMQWCLMTGDLPIRAAVSQQPDYQQYITKYPGIGVWVDNLRNATQARPVLAVYPKISTAVGQAVQAVLLGKMQPQQALSQAATQVNSILAAPS